MADTTGLQAAVDAAVAASASEQTVADSVVAFINNFSATMAAAIAANDALDQTAIDAATSSVNSVRDGMLAQVQQLSAAITTPGTTSSKPKLK